MDNNKALDSGRDYKITKRVRLSLILTFVVSPIVICIEENQGLPEIPINDSTGCKAMHVRTSSAANKAPLIGICVTVLNIDRPIYSFYG